jgi:hypothetical protein
MRFAASFRPQPPCLHSGERRRLPEEHRQIHNSLNLHSNTSRQLTLPRSQLAEPAGLHRLSTDYAQGYPQLVENAEKIPALMHLEKNPDPFPESTVAENSSER